MGVVCSTAGARVKPDAVCGMLILMDDATRDAIREIDFLGYVAADTADAFDAFASAILTIHELVDWDAPLPEDVYFLN